MKLPNVNSTCRKFPNVTRLLEEALYSRRRAMGISQYTLSERAGLTRNCIQQMECRQHLPKTETVFDIMLALEFSEEERREFLAAYLEAYYQDRSLQREQEKELAGAV